MVGICAEAHSDVARIAEFAFIAHFCDECGFLNRRVIHRDSAFDPRNDALSASSGSDKIFV